MRVAIVGNGPSAIEYGKDIDACDFVVRMCAWWVSRPGDSGTKLDAYAWYGTLSQAQPPPPWNVAWCEHWFCLPPTRRNPPNAPHCGLWQTMLAYCHLRPTRWITERMWQQEAAHLMVESQRLRGGVAGWDEVPPSTGFTAADIALCVLPVTELHLFGFDATTQDRPGWGDHNPIWSDAGPHDLWAEKSLLARLADAGVWLGQPKGVEVVWPARPAGLGVEASS